MFLNVPQSDDVVRIIPYFSPVNHTSCFIVALAQGTDAIIIDPVHMDAPLYEILLHNKLDIRWVMITHPEGYMQHAVKTLCRIYDYTLVVGVTDLFGVRCDQVTPDPVRPLELSGISVQAIPVLPHSRSSFLYLIDTVLFTGSIVHAGTLGETISTYNEELLVATVKDHVFTLPHAQRDILLMPSVGPPTSVRAELHLSPFYRDRAIPG